MLPEGNQIAESVRVEMIIMLMTRMSPARSEARSKRLTEGLL
jgi:hypothetical protein